MRSILLTTITLLLSASYSLTAFSQTVLKADGPGNTYELINSVLAPGNEAVENPECVHPAFGRHIAEVWDADLNQYVFEFYIHVTPDNDRCINFDRQRVEIKSYEPSPSNLKGAIGETVEYKWMFKLPTGFQPSSNFTHIHQIKAVGGDDSDPIFTLTCRKGSPNKLELNYYSDSNLSSIKLTSVNLSLFENTWVEATERIYYNTVHGTYSINIKRVSDNFNILSYSNNDLLTYRPDNSFTRPKWGIYRSLLTPADLRDEAVRFNNFSINENPLTTLIDSKTNSDFKVSHKIQDNKLKIQFYSTGNEKVSIDVYSSSGQKIKNIISNSITGNGLNEIDSDVNGIYPGIYIVRCTIENKIQTVKFVKCL